ncbi:MAG: replicative DNA helicase [Desulfobacteraceae bacterium]|jgi:replicative DNA helicase|nr:MAG: replicative DNA helicase [Desulfobacteraceae bacterium]
MPLKPPRRNTRPGYGADPATINDTFSPVTKDPSSYKVPPQNIDAEESIISAVLMDNNTLVDILDVLRPEDFYRTAHQKIFEAFSIMSDNGDPIDLVTLAEYLRNKNQLEAVGGAVYLAKLVDTAPVPSNATDYAKIIRDKAILRSLITASADITSQCFNNPPDVDDVIDQAQRVVFEIAEEKRKPTYHHIGDILHSNFDMIDKRKANPHLASGILSGFTKFDTMTAGFQNSDLIIIAARPGMGKTALALNFTRNAAMEAEVPVVFFSLEMAREQLSLRLLCAEARVNSARVRDGSFTDDDFLRLSEAANDLSTAPIYIDDAPGLTSLEIKTKVRRLKKDKKIGLVIIDYLQLMTSRSHLERRDLEISEMSRSLKNLAKEVDIPIIALSQLNRGLESRQDKRPILSDLRESGALEQDADLVVFLYRDELYNKEETNPNRGMAELILAKQRNGPTGMQNLRFLDEYTRFENFAYGYDTVPPSA